MASLRTREMSAKYKAYREAGGLDSGCVLCAESSLQEFTHWRIIPNNFPYDLVAKTHHMIVPKEHLAQGEISTEAWLELDEIKKGPINDSYDFILEATLHQRSIPSHFHLHLVVIKEKEDK